MKKYKYPTKNQFFELCQRPVFDQEDLTFLMKKIFNQVASEGDIALRKFSQQFDDSTIADIRVSEKELQEAYKEMDKKLEKALIQASRNIEAFHQAQKPSDLMLNIAKGIQLEQRLMPIEKVGIYIPGGTAPLLSTILMLAIPAQIMGCKEIILCSPPSFHGDIHPRILATASFLGIEKVYRVGGAQAIAAMALGTESVPKVMKIFGPGNQYVTAAKSYALSYGVAMDLPAGPSELLVYADDSAESSFAAADLLSQAEHGIDSQVILLTTSERIFKEIDLEINNQLITLPRKDIAAVALKNARIILVNNENEAIDFINAYAPEHLVYMSDKTALAKEKIINAGSVFLGHYCPESAGDYASGTNHTLPTNGWAKSYSGVTLDAFGKKISYQSIDLNGLEILANSITTMARAEDLEAHARAVDIRLNSLNQKS